APHPRVRVPAPRPFMSSALALTPHLAPARPASSTSVSARLSVYAGPTEPPVVDELRDDDPAGLVEALCDAVGDRSPLPAPAIREVVDNLVHAGFRDAVVSILDGGFTVRV